MYTRITKAGGRQYLQLVESFRNDAGKVRTRVVANLGRLDQLTPERLDPMVNGLNRAVGRAGNTASEVIQEPGRSFGDVFALHELWRELGIDTALTRALRSARREIDAAASPLSLDVAHRAPSVRARWATALQWQLRAMVFNRLCTPESK